MIPDRQHRLNPKQILRSQFSIQENRKGRMLDHSEKVSVDSEDMERRDGDMIEQNRGSGGNDKKTCADCGTSKTPLWRSGPAGPKSLCNACGIRSRKKKRGVEDKKPKKSVSGGGGDLKRNPKLGESLKQRLMDLGMTERSTVEKQRRKLGEEEQAAVLLMALSYGSVYA